MNKKGFTLIELISVITIIGILLILIVPEIMIIRKNSLENALTNQISMIENAAKDYAQEHITDLKSPINEDYDGSKSPNMDCIYRNVNFLINNGYISNTNTYTVTDEESGLEKDNQLLNPVTGESMNNRRVCIRFDTNKAMKRKVIAYLVEE